MNPQFSDLRSFPGASNDSVPEVSVIIPALNEEAMLGKCLASLAQSCSPRPLFEVILVDNGSTDRTLEVAQSFSSELRLKILQRIGGSIAGLRNLGAASAAGKILAFLDADCVVPATWVSNAERYLQSEAAGITGGHILIPRDSRWPARVWYEVAYPPRDGEVSYVPSGNLLVRRSSFVALGGFDERLKTSEDDELCQRARQAGLPVRAVSEIAVVHLRTPQTMLEFYRRERWHGVHAMKAFWQNPAVNYRAVAFAAYTLLCCAGVLVGVGAALVWGRYSPAATALTALLVGVLACSLRKLRTFRHGHFWRELAQLTLLHLAYAVARAQALLTAHSYYPRSPETGALSPADRRTDCLKQEMDRG